MTSYQKRNAGSAGPTAEPSSYQERMAAYDKLPKVVRNELAENALDDYTAIHFYQAYAFDKLTPMQLIEQLWRANIRDQKLLAKEGAYIKRSDKELESFKWNPAPIRAGRTLSPRESRLRKLLERAPMDSTKRQS
jgi:hypothetical protein